MDRRLAAIVAVCIIEAGFRFVSGHVAVDRLAWTLLARTVEMGFILAIAFEQCGVVASSVRREMALGLAVSAAFGVLVIAGDLASRVFIDGGLLGGLLAGQAANAWLLYFITACVVGPFVEELFFRGLLYAWMRQGLAAWLCIALTSVLFASVHGHLSVVQLVGGVLFAGLYEWRNNVWPGFVLHAAANFGLWVLPVIHPLV